MSERPVSAGSPESAEMMTALFAQLVMQQTNMALMLLGKVPHPESGQVVKDIEAARLFIDQLEMLELKTKGNLTKDESGLLKQSLMNLHLAFVQAVESQPAPSAPPSNAPTEPAPATQSTEAQSSSTAAGQTPTPEEEHRKKFSKKY